MLGYIGRKTIQLISLLIGVAIISFTLVSLSPIDPVRAYIGDDMTRMSAEQRLQIAQRWGSGQPAPTRFLKWLGQIAQGNLGDSLIFNKPVIDVIGERFTRSLWLMGMAWLLSGIFGYCLGIIAGAWKGSALDRAIRFYAYTLASTPAFWLGMLLLIVFSVKLQVTPVCCAAPPGKPAAEVSLWEWIHHLILPAATLSIIGIANVALHTRQKLIDVLHSDYALFARAQGDTTWGIICHHGLRNISLPALTLQFASFSELFGGAVLAEQVFSYPGLGQTVIQAGLRSDVPLLLGVVLFSAIFVFTGNTLADLSYRVVDPRIRIGGRT
ncbi:ABC transporter permease [Desulfosarcina ovata]|uniref:ABC transporter permease n=1 Tax=Desulfosarcina ovata subsp. ovata TaxID=2752305 RepID=A0A5K8AC34_9BACT|nr:ABC transporter permease [Desulfosarcina ovata]BBO89584.1 ABC transporter permease [Desulfosarcina ovata subsp. ovata]